MKPLSDAELGEWVLSPIVLPGYASTPDGRYRGSRMVIALVTNGRTGTLESRTSSLDPKNVQALRRTASPPKSPTQKAGGSKSISIGARHGSGTPRAIAGGAWPAATTSKRSPRTWALPTAQSRSDAAAAARAIAERYFDSDLVLGRLLDEMGISWAT